jgi:pimeloyl-ACP methyl ester carboxylesterase
MRDKFKARRFHETIPRRLENFSGGIVLLLLLLSATGCVSRIAAGRIVAAPNQSPSSLNKKMAKFFNEKDFQKEFLPKGSANPFITQTIPVGPPDAKLKAMVLPPRDYHVKIISKVGESPDGKRHSLSLSFVPATNSFAPLKEPATIFILHGYTLTKESMMPWALLLAQAGYRVVLVDLRGHGQSTGWQVSFGKYETADLSRVLDYLTEKQLCDERVGVLGLSYGATLGLHWAAHDSRVQTVVAIAPYNQPDEAIERFAVEMKIPVSQKTAREAAAMAATKLDLKWSDWSGETAMRQIKQPVLLIGAEKDTISRPDDIARLKQFAASGSQSMQVPVANHIVVGLWFHDLTEPVTSWFDQHLERTPRSNGKQLLFSEKANGGNSPSKSVQQSPK